MNTGDVLQQPKLLLLGTNDPYWTADAAQLYYPGLEGAQGDVLSAECRAWASGLAFFPP